MKIALISNDVALVRLCQEVVRKLPTAGCTLEAVSPGDAVQAALYLWDLDSKPTIPAADTDRPTGIDVFLVRRSEHKAFLIENPQAAASTLLKPVNPVSLEVFLDQVVTRLASTLEEGGPASADDLHPAGQEVLLECLLHANMRFQEFEEERTNFWARVAHDLRAPLTAANGYCGMLLEEQVGPLNAEQCQLLERIQNSLKRLIRMSSAMFQLTAGETVEHKFELKRTDIESCIKHAVDEIRFFAAEKNLTLDVAPSSPGQPIYVEPTQIGQVLVNLLENACKFTPRHGVIEVRGYPVHCWFLGKERPLPSSSHPAGPAAARFYNGYRVDVQDSGPGISAGHLPHIFDEYVSYGSPKDRTGGGLGLAICRMIIRAHHGRIWAETKENGSILSFVVPFNQSVIQEEFKPAVSYAH